MHQIHGDSESLNFTAPREVTGWKELYGPYIVDVMDTFLTCESLYPVIKIVHRPYDLKDVIYEKQVWMSRNHMYEP